MKNHLYIIVIIVFFAVGGCVSSTNSIQKIPEHSTVMKLSETEKINDFFEETFDQEMARLPEMQTYFGMKKNDDKWNDLSDAETFKKIEIARESLAYMRANFDYDKLTPEAQMSYRLFVDRSEFAIASKPWVYHTYPINQYAGKQSGMPAMLINAHTIDTVEDANNYIARLIGFKNAFNQIIEGMETRTAKEIIPPKFVFPHVYRDIGNIIKGKPFFQTGENSPLYDDFLTKIAKLDVDEDTRADLIERATNALINSTGPAFKTLEASLRRQEKFATNDDGVWKLPDGEAYYQYALRKSTSSNMTADELHQIGLAEVDRIQGEVREIMRKTGFEGDLKSFHNFMKGDQFFYPNTDEGRVAYLQKTNEVITNVKAKFEDYFLTLPKAAMVVKRVEPFREKSAGIAFGKAASMDGTQPGIFYTNLYDMSTRPTYNIESIAYHEGTPGHHMQFSLAQEMEGLPMFRRLGFLYLAYGEGWALYAEWLGKDMGFYQDPYSDFGRLTQELWRAIRIVVDTGIHHKRWTRQQVIDYHLAKTPNTLDEIIKETERYIVSPGQATSYKVGMLKIMGLRELAIKELGDNFDVREFHAVILKNGAVPLTLLEENIVNWIKVEKQK